MALDCLWLAGRDLRDQAPSTRRDPLERVRDDQDLPLPARRLADHGLQAWAQVLERGYEGLVAKNPASPYCGDRTRTWL
jgi:ATP-dependent DNA ligase